MSDPTLPAPSSASSFRGGWLDAAVPLGGALALIAAAVLSVSRARFWMDEWLSWYLVTDPSLGHMLGANADVINAAPPLYFVLARGWAGIFGPDALSLRAFTAACFACGLFALWWPLRRAHGRWAAATAALVAVGSCAALQRHNVEARFYGLYFAEIAAGTALAVALVTAAPRRSRPPTRLLVLNALVHGALCLTNYFGFVYSGALLAALVLAARHRPRVASFGAGSILVGWLAFLPWVPGFLNHTRLGGQAYWTPHPYLPQLFEVYGLQSSMGFTVLVFAAAAALVEASAGRSPARTGPDPASAGTVEARRVLQWVAFAFALVPAATWVFSQSGTSLFLQRYLFPTLISFGVLWAELARRTLDRARTLTPDTPAARAAHTLPRLLFAGLMLVHVVVPLGVYRNLPAVADRVDELESAAALPIVVEHAHDYLHYAGGSRHPESYVFLLDEGFVRSDESSGSGLSNHQIVEALARHYDTIRTEPADEFLRRNERFIVVDSPRHNWFDVRVLADRSYAVEPLAEEPGRFLVTRAGDG